MEGLDLNRDISLYIHIPFCKSKCSYCAFYSTVDYSLKDEFLDTLLKQITQLNKVVKKPYKTIFIGGGNPGVLGFDNLLKIAELASSNGKSEEFTIEINPEYVTEEIEKLFKFVNRISVGIQSFSNRALKTIGRNACFEDNINALTILSAFKKKYNIHLNGDLITCIPGEGVDNTINDINTLSSFDVDHISLYSLTFEEGTKLTQNCKPIDEEEERQMLISAWQCLENLGYKQYEVSNFAKKGYESIHNQVYWNLGQYIGLGPTAESSVGYEKVISLREKDSVEDYIKDPSFDAYRLSTEELEEEYLLTHLRVKEGISKKDYQKRFSKNFDSVYKNFIKNLDKELYIDNCDSFSLTKEGILVENQVILTLAMAI
ncbi:radical SAM family heme chaperone HemW [Bullifex sp.]|uniref:radical SAM family heme chaperone HemW n=1 Tax=Bullifex sp. TaxID=2815808 RepID=UPI002A82DAA7|nr:radical SAM family heme chaperone HemW [Bullifex sp.]MDY4066694.1 radical SAM family heme chaperone HemW [Bullifex sp.]